MITHDDIINGGAMWPPLPGAVPASALSMHGDVLDIGKPIVLVGLMGAGKTSIGRRLSRRLDVPFADADDEIVLAAGQSIADIFATLGESVFRDGERRVIDRLLKQGPQVLATGGGAFIDPQTRARIKASAVSVWLRADLDVLIRRTSARGGRPLLDAGDPREVLARLMDERYPVYAEADLTVDSGDQPPEHTVQGILSALQLYLGQAASRPEGMP